MPPPEPFWLCHECGAQMRPLMVDGVPHCASCHSEFIEILDADINPDPFHELPLPPPTRPGAAAPAPPSRARIPTMTGDEDGEDDATGSMFRNILSNIFTGSAPHAAGATARSTLEPNLQPFGGPSGRMAGGVSPGGTTYRFNVGGGSASITFGTFGAPERGREHTAGDPQAELEAFFGHQADLVRNRRNAPNAPTAPAAPNVSNVPFAPNTPNGPNGDGADWFRALMSIITEEGVMPGAFFTPPRGNVGDYVMSEQGFNDVLERLMQAAGPQGPIPASELVIKGLPRFKFDKESLESSPYKDCPVCKDDFIVGDEVMRIPCAHLFHPECLEPWLKVNGSCPVCRFSLVPAEEDNHPPVTNPRNASAGPSTDTNPTPDVRPNTTNTSGNVGHNDQSIPSLLNPRFNAQSAQSAFTNILNRLWGQGGGAETSHDSSSTDTHRSSSDAPVASVDPSESSPTRFDAPRRRSGSPGPSSPHIPGTPRRNSSQARPTVGSSASAIPQDYRERHARREREQHEQEHGHEEYDPFLHDLD